MTNYKQPRAYLMRPINDPDLRVRDVDESLGAAYEAHRKDVADMRFALGAPLECHTIPDYLRRGEYYMTHYYARRRIEGRTANEVVAMQLIVATDFTLTVGLLIAALLIPRSSATLPLVAVALVLPLVLGWLGRYVLRQYYGAERADLMS
jgi:hypothetical protein